MDSSNKILSYIPLRTLYHSSSKNKHIRDSHFFVRVGNTKKLKKPIKSKSKNKKNKEMEKSLIQNTTYYQSIKRISNFCIKQSKHFSDSSLVQTSTSY